MDIKKSITSYILIIGIFFSAHSQSGMITISAEINNFCNGFWGTTPGAVADYDKVYAAGKAKHDSQVIFWSAKYSWKTLWVSEQLGMAAKRTSSSYTSSCTLKYSHGGSCDYPMAINPSSGVCEEPPTCEPPLEVDDNFECVLKPFCERNSTWDEIMSAEMACADTQGIFRYSCSDFLESLDMSCTQPRECVIGMPTYPECLGDIDPTDPIEPPNGGWNPSTPPVSNPKPPTWDKDQPDDVTPTDTTDTAVLKGIQNLNRDNNQALGSLNTDLNIGFADVNTALNQLNLTNNAIGQSIHDQMNQDYKIHQANKETQLQTTGAIMAGTDATVGAISGQTGVLGNKLDAIGTGIDNQSGFLGDKLDGIADILEQASPTEPCDPTTDPRGCENAHGLDNVLTGDIIGQLTTAVDERFEGSDTSVTNQAQSLVNAPLTDEVEGVISNTIDSFIATMPSINDCSPFSIPTIGGREISFGCEFSVKLKVILSYLLYIYTAMTLIDILLVGVTPAPHTVPHKITR